MVYYNSKDVDDRGMLVGCTDGFIRVHDDDTYSDNVGETNQAIDSYVVLGPFPLNETLGSEGIITNIHGVLAGGGSGGSQSDSSNVTYSVFVGDSPEKVMENVNADTYDVTGTLYAPGYRKGKKQRKSSRGKFGAVKLRNNTTGQTWSFESVKVDVIPVGRLS